MRDQTQINDAIPVIKSETAGGIPIVMGTLTAGWLTKSHEIPRRNTRTKTGYQREISKARVNRLVSDLKKNEVDIPTSILLNLRRFDEGSTLITDSDGNLLFRLTHDEKVHVVDGQHRVAALCAMVSENPEKWSGLRLPFICMLGATEDDEVKHFYVVNSTAKSVKTDLALDLLKQRANSERGVMTSLIERGQQWKIIGQELSEKLAETLIWKDRIRFAGDPPGASTVTSTPVVNSLKPLLSTPYFGALPKENQVKIIKIYWEAIREVLPEPFENPQKYAIQKAIGIIVLHGILVNIIEYIRSIGRTLLDTQPYRDVLHDVLENLEGDTPSGQVVRGSDFWLVGEGAAGAYSGHAGQRVLMAKLKAAIPEPEIE